MIFFISVMAIIGLTIFFGFIRSSQVYNYRQGLIDDLHRAATSDVRAGRDSAWRYEVYESVTYNEMVFKFWHRLDSFYPDKSFIRPTISTGQ